MFDGTGAGPTVTPADATITLNINEATKLTRQGLRPHRRGHRARAVADRGGTRYGVTIPAGGRPARPAQGVRGMRTRLTDRPALEWLEGRELPAVTIQFDYSFDTGGFFDDPVRRAVLQQAADDLGARLDGPLAPIVPGGGNSWSETFLDPATGRRVSVVNPVVA